jgi:hypothetical protein
VLLKFMYSEDETFVSSIKDVELLFEIYRLADKVRNKQNHSMQF